MLSLNNDALNSLRESSLSGVLRIGSPHDIADTILPPILSHIARSAPRLRLEIDVGRSPFLMDDLHRGKVDEAGSVLDRHEVGLKYLEGFGSGGRVLLRVSKVGEHRGVATTNQIGTFEAADYQVLHRGRELA